MAREYDRARVLAFQRCVIDLAEACGVSLLEMFDALRACLLSVEMAIYGAAKGLGEEPEEGPAEDPEEDPEGEDVPHEG